MFNSQFIQQNVFFISCLGIWWCHKCWISKILKFDFLENGKSFWNKKTFSQVSQVLSFKLKKQTSKNVANTTFTLCLRCHILKSYHFVAEVIFKAGVHYFFSSQDIQIFVFLSCPLFLLVKHCFRGWSNINLKVYDIINCLNKKLITRFVWYFGMERTSIILTWNFVLW